MSMFRSTVLVLVVCALLLPSATLVQAKKPTHRANGVRLGQLDPNQDILAVPFGFRRFPYTPATPTTTARPMVEMFFNFLCDGCRHDYLHVMKNLSDIYRDQIDFVFHPFSMCYMRNSFTAMHAAYVMEYIKPGSIFDWMEVVFKVQDQFGANATKDLSDTTIVAMLADLASTELGVNRTWFIELMNEGGVSGTQGNLPANSPNFQARAQWKQATSRGVSYTPNYFFNGTPLLVSDWVYADWIEFLEAIIAGQQPSMTRRRGEL